MTARSPNIRSVFRHQSGSAIVTVLAILAVTFIVVGSALFEASKRFRTSNESSRWAQAGQAAEAGVEVAMVGAQKDSWAADGWSAAPGSPGATPVTKTISLDSGVPATGPISTSVSVDKVTMGSSQWLRIRSKGMAQLAGAGRAGIDRRDILLRKLSVRADRSTGSAMAAPQAIRTIEVLAQPNTKSPFVRALLLNKRFNMSGGGWIDSFDSSNPAKSTNGLYDVNKRQSNGNVGVNDTEGSSDLKDTFVYGSVAYSGPAISGTTNVQGPISTPFSEPVAPVLAPIWTSFNATPSVINNSTTLTGGPQSSPVRYKVSSLTVSGGKVLTIAPHAAGQESYVEVWVTGSFTTSGSGYILQQPGVHVTYHIQGDVTVSGSSFNNQSNIAANNIINVVTPASGVNQKVTVSGGGTFIGAINAPGAAFTVSGSSNLSGSFIGKNIVISGGASVHYDEALAKFNGGGGSSSWRVASWVEAVR